MVNIIITPIKDNINATISLYKALHNNFGLNCLIAVHSSQVAFWNDDSKTTLEKPALASYTNSWVELEQRLLATNYSYILDGQSIESISDDFETLTFRNLSDSTYTYLTKTKSRIDFTLNTSNPLESLKPLLSHIYTNGFTHSATTLNNDVIIFKGPRGNYSKLAINNKIIPRLKNQIRLYPICNWQSSENLIQDWSKFYSDSNIKFVNDKSKADFFLVINQAAEQTDLARTLWFCMEPHMEKTPAFYNYFNYMKANRPLFYGTHDYQLNNVEWHLSLTRDELLTHKIEKKYDKTLSVVVSEKNYDEGHKLRLAFIKKMDDLSAKGELPFDLHIYGTNSLNFKNYKGSLPRNAKDNGILPYKYHFNAENNSIENYITEKFTDALVGECLMFYWGCKNVKDYYDEKSFVYLTLKEEKFEEEVKTISDMMERDEWSSRIDVIKQMKDRVLNEYNMFTRYKAIIALSRTQLYYRVVDKQQSYMDTLNSEILKNSSFSTIHLFDLNEDNVANYIELIKANLNNGTDMIYYPSKTASVKPKELYRKLWKAYVKNPTQNDIIVLSESDNWDLTRDGFFMSVVTCEKILIKFMEIVSAFPNAIIGFTDIVNLLRIKPNKL